MGNGKLTIEDLTLKVVDEIHVRASIETTFESLLEQLGPLNEVPEKGPMPMKLEAWPGGRWYRDLGTENGHFWATVQAIKRPTLLEYRLSEEPGGTLIKFRHLALGLIDEDHRKGVSVGWNSVHARVKAAAERKRVN